MERGDIYNFIGQCRSFCIEQLQKEVVDVMYDRNVLTEEEHRELMSYERREDQIICILDKLPQKGPEKFNIFSHYINDWYRWIIDDCFVNRLEIDEDLKEVGRILDECDVPSLPSYHVKRKEEYVKLCNCLHQVKRNEYVVVSGMRGCGKSTVVADVLRNSYSLTLDAFKKKVFWLKIGRKCFDEELTVLQELCIKLISFRGYNLQTLPVDSKSAKQFLKDRLRSEELLNCLLVLDDVTSVWVINAFDINCKILITTDDEDIMNKTNKKTYFVKISDGFTEDETLRLFSKSIGTQQLPKQAKYIHSICKGFPMTIALINSQLKEHKEDVLNNTDRWDFYVTKLKDEDLSSAIGRCDEHKSELICLLYEAIDMSIKNLNSDLQNFYYDFTLFMEDVNITPEVLCTLWEITKKNVEDIMKEFEKKCLIIRGWSRSKNSYIYCVHDVLLRYLKKQFSDLETQELHQKLIFKYKKKFGENFTDFPVDDNYIFLYLGHHLKEANFFAEFPRLYYCFDFIEKKIMNYGVANLLHDFTKYQIYLFNNAENAEKFKDFFCFIKRIGIYKLTSNSDIIQFALCEHKESSVYKLALQVLQNNDKKFPSKKRNLNKYFECLSAVSSENPPPTVYYAKEEILTATFLSLENIIIANSSATIKLINIINGRTLMTFKGHTKKITLLQLTKNMHYFLSASDDCSVRIWFLNDYSNLKDKSYSNEPRTPSPQLKQTDWYDPWFKQRYSGESAIAILHKHTLPVKCAQFSNNNTMVITTSNDLKLIIWKLGFEKRNADLVLNICGYDEIRVTENIECCGFSNDDEYILCAAQKGIIFIYQSTDGNIVSCVTLDYEIKFISVVPSIQHFSALILGENYFSILDITPEKLPNVVLKCKQRYRRWLEQKRDDCYICGAVSWDGKYVAVTSTNYNILIYEIEIGKEILKFGENNGRICGISWSRQNCTLLTIYNNSVLKLWRLPNNGILNNYVKPKSCVFGAAWIQDKKNHDDDDEGLLVTAALNNNNQIIVYHDLEEQKILNLPLNVEINHICVCGISGEIIYSCNDGSVFIISPHEWCMECVLRAHCIRVCKLKIFSNKLVLVIAMFVEKEPNTFSLIVWMKHINTNSMIERKLTAYEFQSNNVIKFSINLKTNSLYIIKNNHQLKIYDYIKTALKHEEINLEIECAECVKFADISYNFLYIATGNDKILFLRAIDSEFKSYIKFADSSRPTTCKFTNDENNIVIGFNDGRINIYEIEKCSKIFSLSTKNMDLNHYKFKTGAVIELFLSPVSFRFLVVYDREIALYELCNNDIKCNAIIHLSVDQIICNCTFTKCVTVNSNGRFKLLKIPA